MNIEESAVKEQGRIDLGRDVVVGDNRYHIDKDNRDDGDDGDGNGDENEGGGGHSVHP